MTCQANVRNQPRPMGDFRRVTRCAGLATHVQFWRNGHGGQTLLVCADCARKRSPCCPMPMQPAEVRP